MIKFENMMNELNETDYSVGLLPAENTKDLVEQLVEYGISPIELTPEFIIFSDNGQQFKIFDNGEWIIEEGINTNLNAGSTIEITGFYDELAWYSKMIGKKFEVIEVCNSEVKVKRGNGKYSYYVGKGDFKLVS